MARLLVIDDEPNTLYSFERCLSTDTLQVLPAATARAGIALVESARPDAVIVDVRLPDMSGLEAYDRIRAIDPQLPVIVITAHGSTDTAIEAMKRGAFDYLLKPVELHKLRDVVTRALELRRLADAPAATDPELGDEQTGLIVGRAPAMQELYKAIGRVAPQDVTVLVLGESGTGKELIARAIVQYSRRATQPFLAINCAAIPESLLESELFGHERGAFTGADRRRIGKFEQVDGGTIFLDEIGDMSPATQSKVLRLLQEQQFERVGDNHTIRTDVRVIAATNKDLPKLVAEGRFREDLYYRLNGFTIQVPPLRERADDLPVLIEHFIKMFDREFGKSVRGLAPAAARLLQAHTWPGNVRELQSAIRYAVVHATGDVITPQCLPEGVRPLAPAAPRTNEGPQLELDTLVRELLANRTPDLYRRVCARVDRVVLEEVLRHARGNLVQAADILGISRTTLRAKLRALGLAVEKQLSGV